MNSVSQNAKYDQAPSHIIRVTNAHDTQYERYDFYFYFIILLLSRFPYGYLALLISASFYAMEIMHIVRLVYDVQSADSGAYKAQH